MKHYVISMILYLYEHKIILKNLNNFIMSLNWTLNNKKNIKIF